jgi:hypothetical protein
MRRMLCLFGLAVGACSTSAELHTRPPIKEAQSSQSVAEISACILAKTDRFRPRPRYEPLPNGVSLVAITDGAGVMTTFWRVDVIDEGSTRLVQLYAKSFDQDLDVAVRQCAMPD